MLLSDALTAYIYAKDLTGKSQSWYLGTLNQFFDWLPTKDSSCLTLDNIQAYLAYRRAPGTLSSWTLHGDMRAIRALCNFMVKKGWLDANVPAQLEMPRKAQLVKETFTDEELVRLFRAAKGSLRDTAILWVLLDTGIRANELGTLTKDNIHLYKDDAYLVVYGKGRKQREVGPLGRKSRSAVHGWLLTRREDGMVWAFPSERGNQRLSVNGLERLVTRLGERAELTCNVNPHKFRHTYATKYMQQPGASIYKLSKLLGHSSVTTTELYLRSFRQREARLGGNSVGDSLAV